MRRISGLELADTAEWIYAKIAAAPILKMTATAVARTMLLTGAV